MILLALSNYLLNISMSRYCNDHSVVCPDLWVAFCHSSQALMFPLSTVCSILTKRTNVISMSMSSHVAVLHRKWSVPSTNKKRKETCSSSYYITNEWQHLFSVHVLVFLDLLCLFIGSLAIKSLSLFCAMKSGYLFKFYFVFIHLNIFLFVLEKLTITLSVSR